MKYFSFSADRFVAFLLAIVFFCGVLAASVDAQTTSFAFQGRLTDGGVPASVNYDMRFRLFDTAAAGTQVGSTLTINNVLPVNGVFTVPLDFGAAAFPGADRWIEISVSPAGTNTFTTLAPRQRVFS
ncbi:MAG: hypothetical protein LC734_02445, partial [Acidobacteria bacterium]|nr:hypothetical protein [Acidobacteriota bacterium]